LGLIFIDTATFEEKDKKDAFEILETLMKDTLCLCYHVTIDGILKDHHQHIREVIYKNTITNGNLNSGVQSIVEIDRALRMPTFTIIPPYNEITITHAAEPVLAWNIGKGKQNDGWAIVTVSKGFTCK
jgi:hypothetical protein